MIKKLEIKINLVDERDEMDDEVEKEEQYIWSPLLLLLL